MDEDWERYAVNREEPAKTNNHEELALNEVELPVFTAEEQQRIEDYYNEHVKKKMVEYNPRSFTRKTREKFGIK